MSGLDKWLERFNGRTSLLLAIVTLYGVALLLLGTVLMMMRGAY